MAGVVKYVFVFFVGYFFTFLIAPEDSGLLAWLGSVDSGYIFTGLSAVVSICIASYTHYKAKEREAESRVFIEKSKVYGEFFDLIFDLIKGVKDKERKLSEKELVDKMIDCKKKMYMWSNARVLKCIKELSDAGGTGKDVLSIADRLMSELRLDLGHKGTFSFKKYISNPE
ncbi:hypothetical protein [Thalassospira tepidiphila]|uniref:hypothetical protein n=1 Tax=Thalassospira tepidiphila TaxID=393657 RepID=UPI003AA7C5D0